MKKLSLIILALLTFGPMAWAQDWTNVSNESELTSKITNGAHIRLTSNITLSGHLTIANTDVTIDLNGDTLFRNLSIATSQGCVIIVAQTGNLTLSNGTISGGWNSTNDGTHTAGGIVNKGTTTLTNVTIDNCKGNDGGAIMNAIGATLNITGGTISNCESNAGGGGIVNKGTATITDCTLSSNTATTRGGAIWSNNSLTVSGCTFNGNRALAEGGDEQNEGDGGAIHLENGTAELSNVTITNNTSKDAGGIFVNSDATLNLGGTTGSFISGNTSSEHGGGGIVNEGITKLTGKVDITNNTCHTNGNGIWNNGTLEMEGNIQIKGNNFDDIFLKNDKVITITGALTGGTESIGIRMETPKVFTDGYQSHNTVTNHFFPSGTINTLGLIEGEGKMFYAYYECTWDSDSKKVVQTVKTVPDNVSVRNVCTSMFDSGGDLTNSHWYVADGTGSTTHGLTCGSGDIHLILCDGASITINEGFYVTEGSTLYIYCQSFENKMGKLISNTPEDNRPGIGGKTDQMGTLIIHGGDITASGGSNAAGIGGRLNRPGKNITIYGGKIKATGGEEGAGIGGGCGGSGEYITIYGGTITANGGKFGAGIGGGNRYNGGGNCNYLNIYGGTITANGGGSAAGIGSGLWVGAGENDKSEVRVTIHGGTINATGGSPVGSTSSGSSENLYLGGAGIGGGERGVITDITINGGIITANAVNDGAGIGGGGNANQDGTITINGGEIHATGGPASNSSYTASKNGGAGIGGGCHIIDFNTGAGGQVVITGGTIYAEGGTGADGNGAAIGHGGGSSANGTLELPNNYSVKAGNSPGTATLMNAEGRESGCRQFYAQIEPCIHDGASFSDNGNGVTFSNCSHCLTNTGTEPYTFQTYGNWNDNTNWFGSIMPGAGKAATVKAAAIIPSTCIANVGNITMQEGGSLTINDGGQLIHTNTGVVATMEKRISAYSEASGTGLTDGWYFIASPLSTAFTPNAIMLSYTYDLYRLNNTLWENYKAHDDFTTLSNGTGYLYANNTEVTLQFTGEIKPYSEAEGANQVSVSTGWNLVGNPFACNVYANQPFYTMNNTKTGIVAVDSYNANAIAPCTGIIINANGTGTVTFTKNAPTIMDNNGGNIQIALAQTSNNRDASTGSTALIDNAIISFNEGSTLPKFRFGENAEIYIPQGTEDYAITYSEKQGEMPLNFKATENGEYTITVNPEHVEMGYLHLVDNLTGADVDLLASPSYTFTAKTTDYESRFKLVFSANGEDGPSTGSDTFAFISNGNIIVNGEGMLQVVDVMGRIIISTNFARNVSTSGMTPGVYVLRLIDKNDIRTQKIVIK